MKTTKTTKKTKTVTEEVVVTPRVTNGTSGIQPFGNWNSATMNMREITKATRQDAGVKDVPVSVLYTNKDGVYAMSRIGTRLMIGRLDEVQIAGGFA